MSDLPDFTGPSPSRPAAVTIGVFDGVHRGHLGLLAQLRTVAAARGLAAVVGDVQEPIPSPSSGPTWT